MRLVYTQAHRLGKDGNAKTVPGQSAVPGREPLFTVLISAYHPFGGPPMENRIGEFLVQIEAMKPYQVDDVLRVQREGDARMFGEIAIELGYINDAAIQKYIEYRHKAPGG
jgi:hypothetical protein